ncbi:MAG: prepilin-type N-terminal cleavage/methylation domain-containing protein [Okeania sp. SIO3H1]|nr:prepilin-type N-terminal cleavage/methylation domain-containing protein [Okeania sp. SIO3H1]
MKTEFKAKFLQHVAKKRKEEGFTLIELLVVIIIIGILSAIALPSFLNQANKAKQSEAKTYIGSLNKGHQAYFAEKNNFTTNIDFLGVGISTQTANYAYTVVTTDKLAHVLSEGASLNTNTLNSYGGTVFIVTSASGATTRSILCETDTPADNTLADDHTDCGQATGGMTAVGGS